MQSRLLQYYPIHESLETKKCLSLGERISTVRKQTLILFSLCKCTGVFGDCPYRLPAKERLQMSRTDYFKFYSENPGIEDMLRGSRTAFVGPDMANVTVIIKGICHPLLNILSEFPW